jgi:hypothetical protein
MRQNTPDSGWSLVANRDGAAALIGALVGRDPSEKFTRSEVADAADVPLKTLYLDDTLEDFVDAGILERVEGGDAETRFALDDDSGALDAARAFDRAVADELAADTT